MKKNFNIKDFQENECLDRIDQVFGQVNVTQLFEHKQRVFHRNIDVMVEFVGGHTQFHVEVALNTKKSNIVANCDIPKAFQSDLVRVPGIWLFLEVRLGQFEHAKT